MPLDPLASRRGPAAFVPAAGVLIAVFVMFGGGAMLAANSLHHTSPPVSSALAPSVPSADAAPAVHTPKPSASRSGHKKAHGKHGAAVASGTGYYTPGASEVREVLQAGQPPVLGGPLEVQAHLVPTEYHRRPPRRRPRRRRRPAADDTTTPGSGSTSGGILGTIIGLL